MTSKTVRRMAILASATLVLGAFVAGPADAKKKKKKPGCSAPTYAEPLSDSPSKTEASKAPLATITDTATAAAPMVIEFDHGPAVWLYVDPRGGSGLHQAPLVEDTKWFNVQIDSAVKTPVLNARLDWATPSMSDVDLFAWDAASGAEVSHSGAANFTPDPVPGDTGAQGWEQFTGASTTDCQTVTFESRAFYTKGEAMTLTIWLGDTAA
jgi:hypothetical protein